jgi:hypothetical protein
MDFQSGMILPTSSGTPLVGLLIVSSPAIFLCDFPPGLTTSFLGNLMRNLIGVSAMRLGDRAPAQETRLRFRN